MQRVGVLALQGGFASHCSALRAIGSEPVEVRYAGQLDSLHGLVLPGGESTTMLKLIDSEGLEAPLRAFAGSGRPILATCAGLILAASEVLAPTQASLALLDVTVVRNGWGRQLDSFQAVADDGDLPLVFIRAPRVTRVGPAVEVLARFRGEPIMIRQANVTAATFHPELASDRRVHRMAFGNHGSAAGQRAPAAGAGAGAPP